MAQPIVLLSRGRAARTGEGGLAVGARVSTALLVAAAAAIHLYLWFDYFHRVHIIGALFLANAAAGTVAAIALLASRKAVVALAAAAYAVGTLGAFLISTRWGLFGYRERFWGTWQEGAAAIELTAAMLVAVIGVRNATSARPT